MNINLIIIGFLIVLIIFLLSRIDTNSSQHNGTVYVKPIGGCAGTRYGCCPNGVTARRNPAGTNCR